MTYERSRLVRLPFNEEGQVGFEWRGNNRYNREVSNSCICKGRRLSVLVEIGYVAHAVTKSSAIPILLETAARASAIFTHGLGGIAGVTNR
jgi:hypothetical protein